MPVGVSHSTTITKAAKWSHKQLAYVTYDYRRLVLKPRPQGKPSDAIASNCIRNRASCDIKVGVAATIGYRLESRTARKFRTGCGGHMVSKTKMTPQTEEALAKQGFETPPLDLSDPA